MGPVWEANHVWLIFILVVFWTCYPVAFGSIMTTLSIPLFIAAVGIIFRGTAYALRSQLDDAQARPVEIVFALSSILTPFAFGTVIGGIATGRVPVGNARGNLITAWLNPVSILTGVLAVAFSAYLSAVYLAADARRIPAKRTLVSDFRARALSAGVVAGALALAGLFVIRADAQPLWHGLTHGTGLAMVIVCAVAGVVTLALVWWSVFGLARASAALAVAGVIAGWAAAQEPRLLPGLTVSQAAADRATLVAMIIGVAVGSVLLVPSLILLFTLFLRGRLDVDIEDVNAEPAAVAATLPRENVAGAARGRLAGAFAVVTLVAGAALLVFADQAWMQGVGALCFVACAVTVFALAATTPEPET
jgi:cytochrome d ubiquinol oxidase subunit II